MGPTPLYLVIIQSQANQLVQASVTLCLDSTVFACLTMLCELVLTNVWYNLYIIKTKIVPTPAGHIYSTLYLADHGLADHML